MRTLEKILDEFIQAYLHVLKTDVLMTSRAGELINTSLDDFIKPWCERIRFMKDTAVLAEREAWLAACGEVAGWYPEDVFDPDGGTLDAKSAAMARLTVKNVQETRARTTTEAPQ